MDSVGFEAKRSGKPCGHCGDVRQVVTRDGPGEEWKPFPCGTCWSRARRERDAEGREAIRRLGQPHQILTGIAEDMIEMLDEVGARAEERSGPSESAENILQELRDEIRSFMHQEAVELMAEERERGRI